MRKAFLLVLLLSFGPLFFWSCYDDCGGNSSPCPEVNFPYFFIKSMSVQNHFTNTYYVEPGWYENYNMHVMFEVGYLARQMKDVSKNGTLLACSPKNCLTNGYKGTKVGVDTVLVIALNDYSYNIKSGDTINGICEVEGYSLEEYISINDFVITEDYLSIELNTPPEENSPQAFRIIYTLDDGRSFEAETEEVYLRP